MTDPPGGPSALGIESVQWIAQGGENLTVRVTGRWRRRRPNWSGQPVLVIEAQGRRHRYPAMPEPPSVTGTAPGTWRMSFSVPAALAPHLGGRAWLQLGSVLVALPVEVEPEGLFAGGPAGASTPAADPDTLAQRRARSSELAVEAARTRAAAAEEAAAELASRVQHLERELDRARREPARLHALVAARERTTRAVEQRAYAERALREELQEQLAERVRAPRHTDEQLAELAALKERVHELEAEIERLRRQADEAEQIAAAARAARERAERRVLARSGMQAELELARWAPFAGSVPTPGAVTGAVEPLGLRSERQMTGRRAPLAAPPPQLESRLAAETQMSSTLDALREEFVELRTLAERESASRAQAQARALRLERELHEQVLRCARSYEAVDELRGEIEAMRVALAGRLGGEVVPAPSVDPERLAAALTRLREASPVPAPGAEDPERTERAEGPASAWLARVFRALAARDAAAAGRLALALLPSQRLVHPGPLAYDLVLEELGCVQVSVGGGEVRVHLADVPRAEAQFQVIGDLPSLARLLASGRVRRRLGRGRARIGGRRAGFAALAKLVRAPLTLPELYEAGVRLPPWLAFTVVSLMVDPSWTKAERFSIAHQDRGAQSAGVYLHVQDGAPLSVTDSAQRGPVTTIVCPADRLLAVLYGASELDAELSGDERTLALLQSWVKRAQSG